MLVRGAVVGVCVLVLVGACATPESASEPSEETTTATASAPSTSPSTSSSTTTSAPPTTVAPPTTSTSSTTTTTAPPEKVFHVEWGPVDGQFTADALPPSIGGVRPDAVVTLNDVATRTESCGSWLRWHKMYCWHFGFTDEGLDRNDVTLEQGSNTLVYRAVFEDDTSMQVEIEVVYDPTLAVSEGFLLDIVPGDPAQAIVGIVDIEPGEDDGLDVSGEPRRVTLPIAEDAAFIILEHDTPGNRPEHARTTEEMLDLVEEVKSGNTPTNLFWGFLLPEEGIIGGVPSTFLINTDGELQQMEQWWSP